MSNETKASFTSFLKKVVKNTAINYYNAKKNSKKEINIEEAEKVGLLCNDSSTFFICEIEEKIDIEHIEDVFSNELFYRAMKKLSTRQKKTLFYSTILELPTNEIAEILNTNIDNVYRIKNAAINNFKKNYEKEKKENGR